MKKKVVIGVSLGIIATLTLLFFLQKLLMPKYMGDIKEGALISEYYAQEKDFDVIFIGDCEVYENFVPVVLWENYGINSL